MFDDCLSIIQEMKLPFSLATARIVTNSASWCIQSLLTDPHITDNDFLFHNNDPLAPPPTTIDIISNINTSKAYVKSYKQYIKKPGEEVLLPILFYIDGAATGQFADLPITPLRITLGIFNRKAREKGYSWRMVGYVPAYSVEEATGNCTLDRFGHTFGFTTSDSGQQIFALIGRGPTGINNSIKIVSCFVKFAKILQRKLGRYVPNLLIYSSIIQNNVLYRSMECYHKEVWRDWVMHDQLGGTWITPIPDLGVC
jgi:hypothetical protein